MRWGLVTTCWLGSVMMACVDPLLLLLARPVTALAVLVIVLVSVSVLQPALAFAEQPRARLHVQVARAALALLAGCSIAGAITSVVPSMAYRSSDDVLHAYGLSRLVAPALWAVILGASVSAIVVPSPRRLALVAGAGIVGWPVFLAIRVLREPLLDLEDRFLLLSPWIVQLYVVVAFAASGLAIALAFGAARLAAQPASLMPPRASAVSRDRPRASRPG